MLSVWRTVAVFLARDVGLHGFRFLHTGHSHQFGDLADPDPADCLDAFFAADCLDLPEETVVHVQPADDCTFPGALVADQHNHVVKLAPWIICPVDAAGKDQPGTLPGVCRVVRFHDVVQELLDPRFSVPLQLLQDVQQWVDPMILEIDHQRVAQLRLAVH